MIDTEDLFFELIRLSLGSRAALSRIPSEAEWARLYEMAQKQSLVGICFGGVQRLCNYDDEDYAGMPELLYLTWMGMAAQIQQENGVVNGQCAALCESLGRDGFRSCILKGQGNAMLYGPLAGLRQSGDIDVWVMPRGVRTVRESRPRIDEYVHSRFPQENGAFVHIGYPVYEDTEVEMHYVPTMDGCPWVNRRFRRMFEQGQDACFNNTGALGFAVPEPVVNVLFNLHHVKRHFITSGIGLRHVLDLYFIFKAHCGSLAAASGMIADLRLRRFLSGMLWVMDRVLGTMPGDFGIEADERLGRYILHEIMHGGNFGHHDQRLQGVNEMGFWARWRRYLSVSFVRARYFPADVFWSYVFRLRVGIWRRTGIEM